MKGFAVVPSNRRGFRWISLLEIF